MATRCFTSVCHGTTVTASSKDSSSPSPVRFLTAAATGNATPIVAQVQGRRKGERVRGTAVVMCILRSDCGDWEKSEKVPLWSIKKCDEWWLGELAIARMTYVQSCTPARPFGHRPDRTFLFYVSLIYSTCTLTWSLLTRVAGRRPPARRLNSEFETSSHRPNDNALILITHHGKRKPRQWISAQGAPSR